MRRIQDKVKDIVEVRPFRSIRDFTADPAETLSNYHFTDATADLMAKWLDGISTVQPGRGAAYALAGYRGVGKSHFLATLGALAASPDLRGRVSESHVEFSAQRLQRRHYPVSYLRRGTHGTLLEEFKAAVSNTFQIEGLEKFTTFDEVLGAAAAKVGDTPWLLLIDTALERGSRVTRDDGEHLSQIAEAAKTQNVFVGVALDDDIAGADGSNAAIVRAYSIDYLDQAHLYKVVNAHVFPKDPGKQAALHDIYSYFREVLPSFRWSEQKFSSLYPLHPAILEVAPYVRLYVHEFALLGFASEAGEKILGRPANSLIALDEVYDNAENGLRKIEDLDEAFSAYDTINSTVVNKIPVMQRLQAKLILKALLLLSLDGQGATASEICASELIFDESDPEKAIATVEELLRTFAEALPNDFRAASEDGAETRYSFKVSSKENLNNALTEAVMQVSAETVPGVLRRIFGDRFPESAPAGDGAGPAEVIETSLLWRGSLRHGQILWPGGAAQPGPWTDWQVEIELGSGTVATGHNMDEIARVIWKPDPLRPDEIDKLRSFYVLSTNVELREKYSEQIRASVHAHSIAAEKILNRSFLEDGKLVIDGFDYNFTEEARAAQSLSDLFGVMLEPLFETRYPAHPYFTRPLEREDVASIVTDLYNGTRRDLADVQSRAQTYAFPLGLVRLEGSAFVPETHDRLAALPTSQSVLQLVENAPQKQATLTEIYSYLRQAPNGLGREAQQMLITAMVAERFVEFVTESGNRINHRSLDLKIIWEDIVGLARPKESSSSSESLKKWAKLFLKDTPFESIDRADDREALTAAFAAWSEEWSSNRVLDRFAELPEDLLNVRIWQVSARIRKSFGSIAEHIKAASMGELSLEDCLQRVGDAFSMSEADFVEREKELGILASFVKGSKLREEAREYVAACEVTSDEDVERQRDRVLYLIEAAFSRPGEDLIRELGYALEKFRRTFSDHFEPRHSAVMNSQERKARFVETMKSDAWAEFDILAKLPGFDQRYAFAADKYRRQIKSLDCVADTRKLLERQPYCHCGFSLNGTVESDILNAALSDTVREGLASFRRLIAKNSDDFIVSIEKISETASDAEVESACRDLVTLLRSGKEIPPFGDLQLKILTDVLAEPDNGRSIPPVGTGKKRERPLDMSQSFADVQTEDQADDPIVLNV